MTALSARQISFYVGFVESRERPRVTVDMRPKLDVSLRTEGSTCLKTTIGCEF